MADHGPGLSNKVNTTLTLKFENDLQLECKQTQGLKGMLLI